MRILFSLDYIIFVNLSLSIVIFYIYPIHIYQLNEPIFTKRRIIFTFLLFREITISLLTDLFELLDTDERLFILSDIVFKLSTELYWSPLIFISKCFKVCFTAPCPFLLKHSLSHFKVICTIAFVSIGKKCIDFFDFKSY